MVGRRVIWRDLRLHAEQTPCCRSVHSLFRFVTRSGIFGEQAYVTSHVYRLPNVPESHLIHAITAEDVADDRASLYGGDMGTGLLAIP